MTSSVLTATYPMGQRFQTARRALVAAAVAAVAMGGFAIGRGTSPGASAPATAPAATSNVGPATPHDVQQFLTPGHGFTP